MGAKQVLHTLYQDKRTKVDLKDKFGDTIMHFAARDGQLEILEYILDKTKKLMNAENQEGKTPLKYATENGHITCAQLLRNADAPLKCGNRAQLIKEMAKKLVDERPDYKKSVISKQTGEKIEKPLYAKKQITRWDMLQHQAKFMSKVIEKKANEIKSG